MTAVHENVSATGLPDETATQLFIGGQWRAASDGGSFTDLNPATGRPLAQIASGTAQDIDDAVRAARSQLNGEWGSLPGAARGRILNKIADLIERDGELLARLEALDVGKPVGQPTMLDVPMAAGTFRHFAGWADKITGQSIPTAGYFGQPTHSYTVREPVGVIGAIVPWNTPLMIS
ncbi:aldehyde dehydrogenase family protein, partial [Rhodococcus sp. WS4]